MHWTFMLWCVNTNCVVYQIATKGGTVLGKVVTSWSVLRKWLPWKPTSVAGSEHEFSLAIRTNSNIFVRSLEVMPYLFRQVSCLLPMPLLSSMLTQFIGIQQRISMQFVPGLLIIWSERHNIFRKTEMKTSIKRISAFLPRQLQYSLLHPAVMSSFNMYQFLLSSLYRLLEHSACRLVKFSVCLILCSFCICLFTSVLLGPVTSLSPTDSASLHTNRPGPGKMPIIKWSVRSSTTQCFHLKMPNSSV